MRLRASRLTRGVAASAAILVTSAALAFGCTTDAPATPASPAAETPTSSVTAAPTPATTADRADGATAQPTATASVGGGAAQPTATATPSGDAIVAGPDRATLEALYDATGGADWLTDTNWLMDAPLGDWHGVTVDEEGRVTALELSGNGLTGRIPSPLSLTGLTTLDLSDNSLIGGIPSSLSQLTNLRVLDLSSNGLHVQVPATLSELTSLTVLDLSDNRTRGLHHLAGRARIPSRAGPEQQQAGGTDPSGDRLVHGSHRTVARRQLALGSDSGRAREAHQPEDPVVVIEQSRRADPAGTR